MSDSVDLLQWRVRVLAQQVNADDARITKMEAEIERLRAALRDLLEGCVWKEAHTFIDGTPIQAGWATKRMPTDEALTAARAALAEDGKP